MEVAHRFADALTRSAVWSGDRCTWLGTTQEGDEGSDEVELTYGTLGPDLYGGVSGIALFLLECGRITGDPRFASTALAALRQAVAIANTLPGEARGGFFSGWAGIAWVLARAGGVLNREDLLIEAGRVLHGLDEPAVPVVADVISGEMGAIPPLLTLARWLNRADLEEKAVALGRGVVARAIRQGEDWTWPVSTGALEAVRPLTGLSHGAAGIGWTLLEVGHRTGERNFLEAARGAFQYEERWFRPSENNWPDFREEDADQAPSCVAWCHGAPGIALTRLRAIALGHAEYLDSAKAALATTREALADRDEWIEGDCSLCHGRAGLGEILRCATSVLPEEGGTELVREMAADAIERYGFQWDEWPCGVRRGSNPSLMLGLAGIGYFYLGLAESELPCILLPGSW